MVLVTGSAGFIGHALTLNLLRPKELLPIGNDFNNTFLLHVGNNYRITNTNLFTNQIKDLVSYYRGAPPQAYPKSEFKVIRCNMSNFQYKSYLTTLSKINDSIKGSFKDVDILKLPEDFFLGPRMLSNIAFPNKSIGDLGFSSFTDDKLDNIQKYSI